MLIFHLPIPQKWLEIKQIIKKVLLLPALVIVILVIIAFLFLPDAEVIPAAEAGIYRRCSGLGISFDDFIKFAAVEPYAPALGAVIDFDPGAFGHDQVYIA